jgi:hypothetical protein
MGGRSFSSAAISPDLDDILHGMSAEPAVQLFGII